MRARTEASNFAMGMKLTSQNQLTTIPVNSTTTAAAAAAIASSSTAASTASAGPSTADGKAVDSNNWRWTGSNFVRSPTIEPWVSI